MRFIFICTFILGLSGCGKKEPAAQDRIDAAYDLIDQGKHDKAIGKLEVILAETGGDSARVALASAYAARAGVVVQNYWKFVASFAVPDYKFGDLNHRFLDAALTKLQQQEAYEESPFIGMGDSVQAILQSLVTMQEYAYRMELLPRLTKATSPDVLKAIEILGEVDESNKGAFLYRSLLRLILIKSLVVTYAPELIVQSEHESCMIELGFLKEAIDVVSIEMRKLIYDLQLVYPSQKNELLGHDEFLLTLTGVVGFLPNDIDLRDLDLKIFAVFFELGEELWQCQ